MEAALLRRKRSKAVSEDELEAGDGDRSRFFEEVDVAGGKGEAFASEALEAGFLDSLAAGIAPFLHAFLAGFLGLFLGGIALYYKRIEQKMQRARAARIRCCEQ